MSERQEGPLTGAGAAHGRVRVGQDLDAFPHLVRRSSRSRICPNHPPPSSNNPASMTSRLGATIDVEQNHVRFLNDLILNDTRTGAYLSSLLVILRRKAGVGGPGCLRIETFPS